tara:strand:- start:55 stop:522 length:468 start_codon:yes stop_codon:yes gene_type:complete
MDEILKLMMFALRLLIVVMVLSFYKVSKVYREKFNRNFILNATAWKMLFSFFILVIAFSPYGWFSADIIPLLTFGIFPYTFHASTNNFYIFSVLFYFGFLTYIYACYQNITKSTLGWGMLQNVYQSIMVILFSVIIVVSAFIFSRVTNKKLPGEN